MEISAVKFLWFVLIIGLSCILTVGTADRYAPLSGGKEDFCYTRMECNPESERWGGLCKAGKRQSPIDINKKEDASKGSNANSPVHVQGDYLKPQDFVMMNSGHTVSIMKNTALSSQGTIHFGSAGELGRLMNQESYIFSSLHFHWGGDGTPGSEHTLFGKRFAMEAHFVHYNSKYDTFALAIDKPDGLAVLGVLFEQSPDNKDNAALNPIVSLLDKITETGSKISGSGLILKDLMPIMSTKPHNAYYYLGSLTTPKCHETVSWIVFESSLPVSSKQLQSFRSLVDSNGDKMHNNFRPTQPGNEREIHPISVFCEKNCEELATSKNTTPPSNTTPPNSAFSTRFKAAEEGVFSLMIFVIAPIIAHAAAEKFI